MKGVVFTMFLEMVEERFSAHMVDDILDDAQPGSGGAYTAVGTYPHEEMVALVVALSRRCGSDVPALLRTFGAHLFGQFAAGYPQFFDDRKDALDFLSGIEAVIHQEVRKLYPGAQLPRFDVDRVDADTLALTYHSSRHFEDLCEGLIRGCITHFGNPIEMARSTVGHGDGRAERFLLTRRPSGK